MGKRKIRRPFLMRPGLILIILLAAAYTFYKSPSRRVDSIRPTHYSATDDSGMHCLVSRIIDGDTFKCGLHDDSIEVRLIGIKTPDTAESEKNNRIAVEIGKGIESVISLGKRAESFVSSHLQGKTVKLELDAKLMDSSGQILAYAYLPDGTMLNALMISKGYAVAEVYPPNVRYQDLFLKLQSEAREKNKGLWNQDT